MPQGFAGVLWPVDKRCLSRDRVEGCRARAAFVLGIATRVCQELGSCGWKLERKRACDWLGTKTKLEGIWTDGFWFSKCLVGREEG